MERADWLDGRVDSADARFLMVTAITHHRFSSPIWGTREVRKLQAELAEITDDAARILHEHQAAVRKPPPGTAMARRHGSPRLESDGACRRRWRITPSASRSGGRAPGSGPAAPAEGSGRCWR
jgi:hypothetical protein